MVKICGRLLKIPPPKVEWNNDGIIWVPALTLRIIASETLKIASYSSSARPVSKVAGSSCTTRGRGAFEHNDEDISELDPGARIKWIDENYFRPLGGGV